MKDKPAHISTYSNSGKHDNTICDPRKRNLNYIMSEKYKEKGMKYKPC